MGKTAFIFPGQGAQVCGMGQDFYENSETAKAVFDRATELLGFSVPELCFEKNDRLDITEYTQAAMVTTSVAMMKVMEERGLIDLDGGEQLSITLRQVEHKVDLEGSAILVRLRRFTEQ